MKKITYFLFMAFLTGQCVSLNQGAVDSDLLEIAKWTVDDGKLGTVNVLQSGKAESTIENIAETWKEINDILPKKWMNKYVKTLELLTDGKDETLAGVKPIDETNKGWAFALDFTDLPEGDFKADADFLQTLIHEFGHILTLNNSQVAPSDLKFQADETRYLTNEGLAKMDSYINQFVQQFWYKNDLLSVWDKIQRTRNSNKKLDQLYDFYLANKTKFHTDYAAESPEEDIAESWYFFVIKDKPTGHLVKDKKILFFYQFDELVAMRKEIRASIR
ncbi:MAG: hypothetical protein AB8G86_29875 [Saprospiraceae bacterium]